MRTNTTKKQVFGHIAMNVFFLALAILTVIAIPNAMVGFIFISIFAWILWLIDTGLVALAIYSLKRH